MTVAGRGQPELVTGCREPGEGMGAQHLIRICAYLLACRQRLTYVHTPMPSVPKHGYSATGASKIDAYMNFTTDPRATLERATCSMERVVIKRRKGHVIDSKRLCTCRGPRNVTKLSMCPAEQERYSEEDACHTSLLEKYEPCATTNATAVHIRRGDKSNRNTVAFPNELYYRWISMLPNLHIYSQGARSHFGALNNLTAEWHLNEDVLRTHRAMVAARIFVGDSTSAFSRSVLMLRRFRGLSYDIARIRNREHITWSKVPTPDAWSDHITWPASRFVSDMGAGEAPELGERARGGWGSHGETTSR